MGHNDLIKRALLVELYKNAPEEIKQIMRTNEEIIIGGDDANKKVAELGALGFREFVGYDMGYKYRVFSFPVLTNEDVANLEQIAIINSNKGRLDEIARATSKTHFWVKFWSIFYFVCMAISTIVLLVTL